MFLSFWVDIMDDFQKMVYGITHIAKRLSSQLVINGLINWEHRKSILFFLIRNKTFLLKTNQSVTK